MASTFISYRREDAAGYAGRLRESLERRLGPARVFRDVDTLRPGQDFVDAIDARLAECRVMLVIIGREWLDARNAGGTRRLDDPYDFVRLEIATALARPAVLLVPVLVEGAAMPAAAALPEQIRPLARRHAVSVRDETWDADIERLVQLIDDAESGSQPSRRLHGSVHVSLRTAAALTVAIVLVVGLSVYWAGRRPAPGDAAPRESGTTTETSPAPGATPLAAGAGDAPMTPNAASDQPGTARPAYTIDIPRLAEAAFEHVVFAVVSGNVVTRDEGRELRLRIRVSNNGPHDANFWDDGFRLTTEGAALAPSSNLNEIVRGHSLRYGIITFPLPARLRSATVQIRHRGDTAGVLLNLGDTGRPPVDEQAEIADSLSQAVARNVPSEPGPLVSDSDLESRLERITARYFVNVTRVQVVVRLVNRGRGLRSAGDITMRIVSGNEVFPPWEAPHEVLEPASSRIVDYRFDLPSTTGQAVLRTTLGARTDERPLPVKETP